MNQRVVIVGAGHGGAQCCASLRQSGWEGEITLIGDEPCLPYHRPPLSKTRLGPDGDNPPKFIRPEDFYPTRNIETITGCRVTGIDRERRCLQTANGEIAYDILVLSLGSTHRKPPIPGIDHERVYSLQTEADAQRLRSAAGPANHVVVIGGGFIGLEAAASLRGLGLEVTVLEFRDRVLARVTSPPVSAYFEDLHRGHGVEIRTGIQVVGIEEDDGRVRVCTEDGTTVPGDVVVVGAGAGPNVELALAAGLEVDNGIRVDEYNRTSDPHIFAIGDCCNQFQSRYGKRLRLESVQNAVDQAKSVAAAITGNPSPYDALPWFWSDQYDVKLQIAGISDGYDQVFVRGNPAEVPPFSAWYFREGILLAVDAVNDAAAYATGMKLMKAGLNPDPADVANTGLPIKELLTKTEGDTCARPS